MVCHRRMGHSTHRQVGLLHRDATPERDRTLHSIEERSTTTRRAFASADVVTEGEGSVSVYFEGSL